MQQAPKILPLLPLEGGARSVADLNKKCNKILNSPKKNVADFNKKCNKHSENGCFLRPPLRKRDAREIMDFYIFSSNLYLIKFNFINFNFIKFNLIQSNFTQFNFTQFNLIKSLDTSPNLCYNILMNKLQSYLYGFSIYSMKAPNPVGGVLPFVSFDLKLPFSAPDQYFAAIAESLDSSHLAALSGIRSADLPEKSQLSATWLIAFAEEFRELYPNLIIETRGATDSRLPKSDVTVRILSSDFGILIRNGALPDMGTDLFLSPPQESYDKVSFWRGAVESGALWKPYFRRGGAAPWAFRITPYEWTQAWYMWQFYREIGLRDICISSSRHATAEQMYCLMLNSRDACYVIRKLFEGLDPKRDVIYWTNYIRYKEFAEGRPLIGGN